MVTPALMMGFTGDGSLTPRCWPIGDRRLGELIPVPLNASGKDLAQHPIVKGLTPGSRGGYPATCVQGSGESRRVAIPRTSVHLSNQYWPIPRFYTQMGKEMPVMTVSLQRLAP